MNVVTPVKYQNEPIVWSFVVFVWLNHTAPDGHKDMAPLVRFSLTDTLRNNVPRPSHLPFLW